MSVRIELMETVGNFPDLASARVAQSLLEGAGIEAHIPDEYLAGVYWQINTAIKGVRLTVAPEDAEAARSILAGQSPEAFVADESPEVFADDGGAEACPVCRSEQFGPPNWKKRIKAIGIFFPPVLILYPLFLAFSRGNECYACGHRWNA